MSSPPPAFGNALNPLKIEGTGISLPERILTNQELEGMVDTSDAWIVERTGIRERRIAAPDVATSDLCASAVRNACQDAGIPLSKLDGLIVATSTSDTSFPSTACWAQKKLGLSGPAAFDVSAGCSGFLYALELASALVAGGSYRHVAIVGGEVMSKVVDWTDRSTCVLFGDGAGAAIVGPAEDRRSGILGSAWGADGSLAPLLQQPAGGTQRPATAETVAGREHTVKMDGKAVFRHAVLAMTNAAKSAMDRAHVTAGDVSLLIPHQANQRIMELTRERCGIAPERMVSIVERYGNMSAATIPVALHEAKVDGRLQRGDVVLMTAFGTGFTWAASVLKW